MGKKIKISIDLEGPLGMYPYIIDSKSLEKYSRLDEFIEYLINFHKKNKKNITIGILGLAGLNNLKDLTNIVSSISLDYPENSLISRLRNDSSFFQLILENKKYFLKGEILDSLNIKEIKNIKIACHSLSHIHIFDENYNDKILETEIKESLNILKKFLKNSESVDLYISPRNQINNHLINMLKKYKIEKIRKSSSVRLYSENHDKNSFLKLFYKLFRLYDRYNLPLSNKIKRSSKNIVKSQLIKEIDSGYFLAYPKYSFLYKRHLSSFKRFIKEKSKKGEDINIWFHPHNMLNNTNLSKRYYEDCHKILDSLRSANYKFYKL